MIGKTKENSYNAEWEDITLKQYYKIQDILSTPDEYLGFNLIDIVYGVDVSNMLLTEAKKYKLDFLKQEPEKAELKKYYTLNGRKYDSNFDLTVVSTAQFMDYQTYANKKEKKFEELLSVFFVPDGHTYGDGYDIAQVQEDLLELDICTVIGASFFFAKQLEIFVRLFRDSLQELIEKTEIAEDKKKLVVEVLKCLGYFPS